MADQVRRERYVPAPREKVWEALTEPARLAEWLAEEAEIELEPGGELSLRLPDGEERNGFVEEVESPARLSFWWQEADRDEVALTRVELTLEEADGGTLLRVAETREPMSVESVLSPTGTVEQSGGPEISAAAPFALVG